MQGVFHLVDPPQNGKKDPREKEKKREKKETGRVPRHIPDCYRYAGLGKREKSQLVLRHHEHRAFEKTVLLTRKGKQKGERKKGKRGERGGSRVGRQALSLPNLVDKTKGGSGKKDERKGEGGGRGKPEVRCYSVLPLLSSFNRT